MDKIIYENVDDKKTVSETELKGYLRADVKGGKIFQESQIKLFKMEQFQDILKNGLLGTFDENGLYSIENCIKKELIQLEKRATASFENMIFASEEKFPSNRAKIKFSLVFEKNKNGNKIAKLFVLERVVKGNLFQNTIKTFLAAFITDEEMVNGHNVTSRACEAFNVILNDKSRSVNFVEIQLPNINKRKKLVEEFLSKFGDVVDYEKKLVLLKTKILKEMGSSMEAKMKKINQEFDNLTTENQNALIDELTKENELFSFKLETSAAYKEIVNPIVFLMEKFITLPFVAVELARDSVQMVNNVLTR